MMRTLLLSVLCVFSVVFGFCSAEVFAADSKPFTVVIDAGHGGKDAGAIGSKLKVMEKKINLSVALELGKLIKENTDARVVYTRKTDVFVPLDERPKIANRAKADLFISIHANAAVNRTAYGTETYVLGSSSSSMEVAMRENAVILLEDDYEKTYEGFDPNSSESYIMFDYMQFAYSKQSLSLASTVQNQFKKNKRTDRGVKQAGFLVLKQISSPGILVELGYLSNADEERYLSKTKSQKELAESIFDAFVKYKADYDKKNGRVSKEAKAEEAKKKAEEAKAKQEKADAEAKKKAEEAARKDTVAKTVDEKVKKEEKEIKKEEKKEDKEKKDEGPGVKVEDGIVYRVQFCSSSKRKDLNSREFKMCVPAFEVAENGIYKYMYGEEKTFDGAAALRKKIQVSFKDAFIVVFKNGVKLPIPEALPYLK